MKRRTEHLVEKRDGRREYLRATKLARSVHLALCAAGVDEDWRALEVANVVLEGLRQRRDLRDELGGAVVLTTNEIADAVQHLLVVTGQPGAAVAYGAVAAERQRRRQSLATLGRFDGVGAGASANAAPTPAAAPLPRRFEG